MFRLNRSDLAELSTKLEAALALESMLEVKEFKAEGKGI